MYRGINEFRKGYKATTSLVKDENENLLSDYDSLLNRWKNCFILLLNVCRVNDVRRLEVYTIEPLILPEVDSFEVFK
jgi:hypothetical protein